MVRAQSYVVAHCHGELSHWASDGLKICLATTTDESSVNGDVDRAPASPRLGWGVRRARHLPTQMDESRVVTA